MAKEIPHGHGAKKDDPFRKVLSLKFPEFEVKMALKTQIILENLESVVSEVTNTAMYEDELENEKSKLSTRLSKAIEMDVHKGKPGIDRARLSKDLINRAFFGTGGAFQTAREDELERLSKVHAIIGSGSHITEDESKRLLNAMELAESIFRVGSVGREEIIAASPWTNIKRALRRKPGRHEKREGDHLYFND